MSEPVELSSYPWLYERGGEPLLDEEDTVEVLFVGDVMLGRGVTADPAPFLDAASWLRSADLTVGNLESVIGGDPAHTGSVGPDDVPNPLQAPPSAVALLRDAGFDVLGLANNHALDLGSQGLMETARSLREAGLTTVGVGSDPKAAVRPLILDVEGLRLALIAANAVPGLVDRASSGARPARWDADLAEASVRRASAQAAAVIVLIHWGYEYQSREDPAQRSAANLLREAGADLVVGHHPHVVQPLEIEDGSCVAYSLGDFLFDYDATQTGHGLAVRAFFDDDGLRAVQALPVWSGLRPRLMNPDQAREHMPAIKAPRQAVSFTCKEGPCGPAVGPRRGHSPRRSGSFWGGSVDLTGDGVTEHVRRSEDRVTIYSEGVPVWRSPTEWRVVDLSAGDPNDDGRRELILALWKPGLDGLEPPGAWNAATPRSRPFIIGYRGGIYRTLWGGSAVDHPILEVELGDVDNDGAEELIVLEAVGDDILKRRVAVWRWHGWGFSLVWRSEPGGYTDLTVDEGGTIEALIE